VYSVEQKIKDKKVANEKQKKERKKQRLASPKAEPISSDDT